MVYSSHITVIASGESELEEGGDICWCFISPVGLGSKTAVISFLRIIEPQESAQ